MTDLHDERSGMSAFAIENEAAEALLDVGVSVPVKEWHIPFRKRPVRLRLVMRRPLLGNLVRISRIYLGMGVKAEAMREWTHDEQLLFLSEHVKDVSRIVAIAIVGRHRWGRLVDGVVAWCLRWMVADTWLFASWNAWVSLLGTKSFESIIRSLTVLNPMKAT